MRERFPKDEIGFTLPYDPPIIAPKGLLKSHCTTNTHVCYIQPLEEHEDYRKFYEGRIKRGNPVILDHSAGLSRIAPSNSNILKWLKIIEPKVVVLPDFNYQADRTIRESFRLLEVIEAIEVSTVGVLQGDDLDSIDRCYQAFKGKVSVIGLPAGLEKIVSRNDLVYGLSIDQPCVFIEVFKSLQREKPSHAVVELMWSAWPLRLAYEGELFTSSKLGKGNLDFSSHVVPEHAEINIGQYLKILKGNLPLYKPTFEVVEL